MSHASLKEAEPQMGQSMNQLNINRPNNQRFSNSTTCDADGLEVTLDVKLENNLQTA